MEGEWSCYTGGGQFSGGRMVMLQSLMEGEWSRYSGHFNGGEMVM